MDFLKSFGCVLDKEMPKWLVILILPFAFVFVVFLNLLFLLQKILGDLEVSYGYCSEQIRKILRLDEKLEEA